MCLYVCESVQNSELAVAISPPTLLVTPSTTRHKYSKRDSNIDPNKVKREKKQRNAIKDLEQSPMATAYFQNLILRKR